jgi:hypothetical protein
MSLIGQVVKMDVDKDDKASGAFLRARVAVEIDKPLRRGVLLRMNKSKEPRWFHIQYEKLPYYCFGCGITGHSEVERPNPVVRDEQGKLPYDAQLRAPEEKKKCWPSFAGAAAESLGSGSSSASKASKAYSRSGHGRSGDGVESSRFSSEGGADADDQEEVQSPLKQLNKFSE